MLQRVLSRFSIFCRFFLSQCQKYSQVNPSVQYFRKFPVAKKFMDKRGEGEYQDFPSKISCLTVPKTSVGEITHLYCCNNFGYRKGLDKGWGEYHDFPSKFLSVTVPKYFIGEHFGVSEKFFYRKFSCIGGGGGASRFCRNFLSYRTETKNFVMEPFRFPEISWYRKKFLDKRRHITIFSRNFYVSQCRKLS